jgi:hypothetical protein
MKNKTLKILGSGMLLLAMGLLPQCGFAADYDGDGKADFAWFVPETQNWRIYKSSVNYSEEILPRPNIGGGKNDVPLVADFDADRKTDLVLFKVEAGRILIKESGTGRKWISVQGSPGWIPAIADYDGDGKADLAWFIPETQVWRIYESANNYQEKLPRQKIGGPKDIPMPADFDGDGKADLVLFRTATGKILVKGSSTGKLWVSEYGSPSWVPAIADYEGDGKADLSWFIPATQVWRIYESSNNYQEKLPRQKIGGPKDIPVPADFDGDGKADLAVFRNASGKLWVKDLLRQVVSSSSDGSPKWIPPLGYFNMKTYLEYWFIPRKMDGRPWISDAGQRNPSAVSTCTIKRSEEEYFRYYNDDASGAGIGLAYSGDGLNFRVHGEVISNACDPSVIELPQAGLRMFYVRDWQIWSAQSLDGVEWVDEVVVLMPDSVDNGQMSVPEAALLPNGELWIYYCYDLSGANSTRVAIYNGPTLKTADLRNQNYWKRKDLNGLAANTVDPDVVIECKYPLFFRLFFARMVVGGDKGNAVMPGIGSAISIDGINWILEEGARVPATSCMVGDPDVVYTGKKYRMYYYSGNPQQSVSSLSATSPE